MMWSMISVGSCAILWEVNGSALSLGVLVASGATVIFKRFAFFSSRSDLLSHQHSLIQYQGDTYQLIFFMMVK